MSETFDSGTNNPVEDLDLTPAALLALKEFDECFGDEFLLMEHGEYFNEFFQNAFCFGVEFNVAHPEDEADKVKLEAKIMYLSAANRLPFVLAEYALTILEKAYINCFTTGALWAQKISIGEI